MRYMIKGGIWKNAEDEVLKAAVMKYGLNQWSRISSLLVRKSAKECKARWYEWLDPSIRKTEWTKEEEEKLLHLAKVFPNQWRTISPLLQRTVAQCVEHYDKLLDKAQGKEEYEENDPRRLRPGEIDPNPETKPARPDEVDMEEDIIEMLQEARARLANTKGKKAKRKAREKVLDEARRLANLQKKRELKAAGIEFFIPKKELIMNYNVETPFERKVPKGRFSELPEEDPKPDLFKGAIALSQLEGKKRDDDFKQRKMIDERRLKKLKDSNLPLALQKINPLLFKENQMKTMLMPEPQVTEVEIQQLLKLSTSHLSQENSSDPTNALLGSYTQREATPSIMRTPKLDNLLMKEAQNLLLLRDSVTPLIGGEEQPLNEPEKIPQIAKTPNALLTKIESMRSSVFKTPIATPKPNSIPEIPKIEIKKEKDETEEQDLAWEKPEEKQLQAPSLLDIKQSLQMLPVPQNEYQLDLSEIGNQVNSEEVNKPKKIAIFKESEVIKRDLPIPKDTTGIVDDKFLKFDLINIIDKDINLDFRNKPTTLNSNLNLNLNDQPVYEKDLELAKIEINAEISNLSKQEINSEEFLKSWDFIYNNTIYSPYTKNYEFSSKLSKAEQVEAYSFELNELKKKLQGYQSSISETEKIVKKNSQFHKLTLLNEEFDKTVNENEKLKIQKYAFNNLLEREKESIISREKDLKLKLKKLEEIQLNLQNQLSNKLKK